MNYALVILLLLSSVGFYNYHGVLTAPMQKAVFYLCVFGSLCYALLQPATHCKYPKRSYLVILVSIVVSAIVASTAHMQPLSVSLTGILPYLAGYICFYILVRLDVPSDKIIIAIIWLCIISSFVYACNALTFPNNMFGELIDGEDTSRGIVRLKVVFINFFPLLSLYAINQWLLNKKARWVVLAGFTTIMIVLSVTRQIIALSAILGIFFLFRKISWKLKALFAIAIVAVVAFVLPMIPVFNTMMELTEEQKEDNEVEEEDIRIQAWRWYTYENQDNAVTAILGNGIPALEKSIWANDFFTEAENSGRIAEDVGWAGFYYYFGLLATLALLWFLYKGVIVKKAPDQQYISYWLVYILLTSIASAPILYYWQVVTVMVGCYLAYRPQHIQSSMISDTSDGSGLERSYMPRYQQL